MAAVVVLTAGISFAGVPVGHLVQGAWREIVHLFGRGDVGERETAASVESAPFTKGVTGREDFERTTAGPGPDTSDTRAQPVHDLVGLNQGPTAVDDAVTTDEDTPITIEVLGNDADPDADALNVAAGHPTDGLVHVERDGTVTYTPASNFVGEDSFTYSVTDGSARPAEATVAVTVKPVNDAPMAGDDTASTDEDTRVNVPVLMNDDDVDGDELTIKVEPPTDGTVEISKDGIVSYKPAPDFNGDDTLLYRLFDGQEESKVAKVEIKVRPVNDDPVAGDDEAVAAPGTPVVVEVLANDTDVDKDVLVVEFAAASNGVVHINTDGTITYTPNPLFTGRDVISYAVSDGAGGIDNGEVAVSVAEFRAGADRIAEG